MLSLRAPVRCTPRRAVVAARPGPTPRRACGVRAATSSSSGCPLGFGGADVPDLTTVSKVADTKLTPPNLADLPRPTGERWWPLVGETVAHAKNHLAWAHERVRKHGPVFASHLVGTPCVVVTDAADIDAVMLGEHTVTEWWSPPSFVRLLGSASDPAAMADKDAHAKRRRQQATAFTPAALASYAPRVEAATRAALAAWADACAAGGDGSGGGAIDLGAALADLTFAYAEATVVDLGLDAAASARLRARWSDFTRNLFTLPVDLPGTPLRAALRARDDVSAALASAVAAYKAAFDAGATPPSTMMSHYMAARAADGDPIQTAELADMALGLYLAGYDTSHAAHTALLALLPRLAPRVRAALAAEQAAVVARHGDALTAAALADMKYADAVSKECLRLLGPAEGLFRRAKTDFALGGRRIAAGDVLYVSHLYAKTVDAALAPGGPPATPAPPPHMDANAPHVAVVPERWLPGSGVPPPAAGTLAFGVGRHACLGAPLYAMEAKALLAVLTREYVVAVDAPAWPPSWAAAAAAFRRASSVRMTLTRRAAPITAAGGGDGGGSVGQGREAATA